MNLDQSPSVEKRISKEILDLKEISTQVQCYEDHSKRLGTLVDNPLLSDVIFIVGNEKIGKKQIYGHKCILASHSEPFKVMFTNGMKETLSGQVEVKDIKPEIFRNMLHYIYTGTLKISEVCKVILAHSRSR